MCVCMYVCPSMHSNCGHFRAKPITFGIGMTRRGSTGHSFSRKVTSRQVTEEKATPLMLWENFVL